MSDLDGSGVMVWEELWAIGMMIMMLIALVGGAVVYAIEYPEHAREAIIFGGLAIVAIVTILVLPVAVGLLATRIHGWWAQ